MLRYWRALRRFKRRMARKEITMRKKAFILFLAALAALSGCAKDSGGLPTEATSEPNAEETTRSSAANEEGFSFADVENLEFYFSSGAGGWATELEIASDGSFKGHYEDSNMGDVGEGYSGMVYYSDFEGKFTRPEKVNDTTYSFKIDSIDYPLGFGEEIKDGTLYKYTEAYGIEGAEEFYMYLPESKISELPEEFLSWIGIYISDSPEADSDELSFYGLYNVTEQEGFSSYEK